MLSWANAGFFPKGTDALVVIGLALFYGALAQLLAGMWEFRSGNTFGATAFSSYGAFWLSFAALFLPGLGGAAALVSGPALGIYLIAWAIFTGYMMICSLRTNGATALVFVLLFLTYVVLGIAYLAASKMGSSTGWQHIGGYLDILTALAAWYTSFAGVLPVYPLTGL